jgi:hypothetical protein
MKAKKEDYEKQLSWLSDLAATKHISKMKIMLFVEVRTSAILTKYKAILLPHIQELVEKDCKIIVSWRDGGRYPNHYERVTYDRTKLLSASQLEDKIANAFVSRLEIFFYRQYTDYKEGSGLGSGYELLGVYVLLVPSRKQEFSGCCTLRHKSQERKELNRYI